MKILDGDKVLIDPVHGKRVIWDPIRPEGFAPLDFTGLIFESQDGNTLLQVHHEYSVGRRDTVSIWDQKLGDFTKLTRMNYDIRRLVLSPHGRFFIPFQDDFTIGKPDTSLKIWDSHSGKAVAEIELPPTEMKKSLFHRSSIQS